MSTLRSPGICTTCTDCNTSNTATWAGYLAAHRNRRAYFKSMGATSTDHGHATAQTSDLSAAECQRLLDFPADDPKSGKRIIMAHPAYDQCIKASHLFNLLDARGVISVTERQAYIGRVRALAKACADAFRLTEAGADAMVVS